ncbi:MAG: hypothetical protein JWM11_3399 [Planctomycetaceae bacterium]|nr:hypothetical protein [Planctomycetaceae bacterium]
MLGVFFHLGIRPATHNLLKRWPVLGKASGTQFTSGPSISGTGSYKTKTKKTSVRLATVKPNGSENSQATIQYSLQARQLHGYDFFVAARAGNQQANRTFTINDSVIPNGSNSGFINPKTEYLDIFVYKDQNKKVFITAFTRTK